MMGLGCECNFALRSDKKGGGGLPGVRFCAALGPRWRCYVQILCVLYLEGFSLCSLSTAGGAMVP
jgi:hypothetical protein